MFYNHELLKRTGRFGVLWLAATKPKVLTEVEYRQCDLKSLCQEIQEYFNHGVNREQGKPLFSLRTCTTLFLGASDVYIQQTRLLGRDCRRFYEKVSRVILGYDSQGNPIQAVLETEAALAATGMIELMPPPPQPAGEEEEEEGRKTPGRGKKRKRGGDGEAEEDEEDGKRGKRGKKKRKGKGDDDEEEDEPKKKRKGKTTLTAPTAEENHLQGWDMLFYDNLLQGIPESDESDFFNPNNNNLADSSRITLKEFFTTKQSIEELDEDEAGFRFEQMLNDDVENVAEPPMPQDLEGEHEEAPQTGVAPETAPAAPIPALTEQPPLSPPSGPAATETAPPAPSSVPPPEPVMEPADQPVASPPPTAAGFTRAFTQRDSDADRPDVEPPAHDPASAAAAEAAEVAAASFPPTAAPTAAPFAAALPLLDESGEILSGNMGDNMAADNLGDNLVDNLTDASFASRLSVLRDVSASRGALHSTRVGDFSDCHLAAVASTTEAIDTSQVDRQDLPHEQLMRNVRGSDSSQDFFYPEGDSAGDAAAVHTLAPVLEASLTETSLRGADIDALPSTSLAAMAEAGAHLSVNVPSPTRSPAADIPGTVDVAAPDVASASGVAGPSTADPVAAGAPASPPPAAAGESAAPTAPPGAPASPSHPVADGAAAPTAPASPPPAADGAGGGGGGGGGDGGGGAAGPPPPKRQRRRVRIPFLDQDKLISMDELRRHMKAEQRKESMEELPAEMKVHLMRINTSEYDGKTLMTGPGKMKPMGTKLRPYFLNNLKTRPRGFINKDGNETSDEEEDDEDEDERRKEASRFEDERERDESSIFGVSDASLGARKSSGVGVGIGSGAAANRSRRADRSADRSQSHLGVPSTLAAPQELSAPQPQEDQIAIRKPKRPSLPVVAEEGGQVATEEEAAVDAESVATAVTTESGDTAASNVGVSTTSNVPTVTITEPSPPDEEPPGGGPPGTVKFPDTPKEKSVADLAAGVEDATLPSDGRDLAPIPEAPEDPPVTPPRSERPRRRRTVDEDEEDQARVEPTASEPVAVPSGDAENVVGGVDPPAIDIPTEVLAPRLTPPQNGERVSPEPPPSAMWPQEPFWQQDEPIAADSNNVVDAAPDNVEASARLSESSIQILPHFRLIPTFQELCPPDNCSKKLAIGVFNGVLRASMKLLVCAIQDGDGFGGEIQLLCRGDASAEHGVDCFCGGDGNAEDVDRIRSKFLDCLELPNMDEEGDEADKDDDDNDLF